MAEWVRQKGYQISDDSLWRYGKGVQRQLQQAQKAVHQARASARIGGADRGVLIAALKAVEQNVLTKLIKGAPVDSTDIRLMNAVANLVRASILHQRRIDEVLARREQGEASQQPKPRRHKELSEEAYHAIRNILLGRDPFALKHSSAQAAADQTRNDIESLHQSDFGFEAARPASTSKE